MRTECRLARAGHPRQCGGPRFLHELEIPPAEGPAQEDPSEPSANGQSGWPDRKWAAPQNDFQQLLDFSCFDSMPGSWRPSIVSLSAPSGSLRRPRVTAAWSEAIHGLQPCSMGAVLERGTCQGMRPRRRQPIIFARFGFSCGECDGAEIHPLACSPRPGARLAVQSHPSDAGRQTMGCQADSFHAPLAFQPGSQH
jgi:hypothetical protein